MQEIQQDDNEEEASADFLNREPRYRDYGRKDSDDSAIDWLVLFPDEHNCYNVEETYDDTYHSKFNWNNSGVHIFLLEKILTEITESRSSQQNVSRNLRRFLLSRILSVIWDFNFKEPKI